LSGRSPFTTIPGIYDTALLVLGLGVLISAVLRGGRIEGMEARGNTQVVRAAVPLSEMFQ
jgi:hypothetical protein